MVIKKARDDEYFVRGQRGDGKFEAVVGQ